MVLKQDRDFNAEIIDNAERQYAYSFDFDVMHYFMMVAFKPYFRKGGVLELGSFKGAFTERLIPEFDDITCVEASSDAANEAEARFGNSVKIHRSQFEKVDLPNKYDNIIMTHVLEHLEDPVSVLRRVNDEWLTETGYFFLVCPNANAASRQIAVKMGLISHNAAVTPGEAEHGHYCTYTLDTLERDAISAGLEVVSRSGIFFKALANFQWDMMLEAEIVDEKYLRGCYLLGQQYPDLCSSIFLLCKKGT